MPDIQHDRSELDRLRRKVADDEAELPIVFWGMYAVGGLVSWLIDPLLVALAGALVAGCYWLRNRRARR